MITRHRLIGGLLAFGLVAFAPACSATFSPRVDLDGDYRADGQRRAYAKGYEGGLDKGRDDARKRRRVDYEEHREYRDGIKGYHRRDGERNVYRQAFRSGFARGYTESYRENSRERDDDRDRRRRR